MNLGQIIAKFRNRAQDEAEPFFWEVPDLTDYANQAEREASERAKLLLDTVTTAVCQISGIINTAVYSLHPSILEIVSVTWDGTFLTGVSRNELDRTHRHGWKTTKGQPRRFIDPQEKYLTLYPIPTLAKLIELEVYRYPLAPMANDADTPEIAERHHFDLIDWMEHLAFRKDDQETQDLPRSERAAARFAANFGPKLDANTRRTQRDRSRSQVCMNPNW